jgi:hypothetical protein
MANNTWSSTGSTDGNAAGNWSLARVPTGSDIAKFDATSVVNCTFTAGINCLGVSQLAAYTGTLNFGTGLTHTFGASGIVCAGTAVDFGNGNIISNSGPLFTFQAGVEANLSTVNWTFTGTVDPQGIHTITTAIGNVVMNKTSGRLTMVGFCSFGNLTLTSGEFFTQGDDFTTLNLTKASGVTYHGAPLGESQSIAVDGNLSWDGDLSGSGSGGFLTVYVTGSVTVTGSITHAAVFQANDSNWDFLRQTLLV